MEDELRYECYIEASRQVCTDYVRSCHVCSTYKIDKVDLSNEKYMREAVEPFRTQNLDDSESHFIDVVVDINVRNQYFDTLSCILICAYARISRYLGTNESKWAKRNRPLPNEVRGST